MNKLQTQNMSGCDILNEAASPHSSSQMVSIFKTPCLSPELHNAVMLQCKAGGGSAISNWQRLTALSNNPFIGIEVALNVPHRDGIQASQASLREKWSVQLLSKNVKFKSCFFPLRSRCFPLGLHEGNEAGLSPQAHLFKRPAK